MPANFSIGLQQNAAQWKKLHNPEQKYDPQNPQYYRTQLGQEVAPPILGVMMDPKTWGAGLYDWTYRWSGGHGRNLAKLDEIGRQNFPTITNATGTQTATGRQAVAAYALHAASYVHGAESDEAVRAAVDIGPIARDFYLAFEAAHTQAENAITAAFRAATANAPGTYAAVNTALTNLAQQGNEVAGTIAQTLAQTNAVTATAYANGEAAARDVRRIANFHIAAAVNRYTRNVVTAPNPDPARVAFATKANREVKFAANSTGFARQGVRTVAPIVFAGRDLLDTTANATADAVNTAMENVFNPLPANDPIREAFTKAAAAYMHKIGSTAAQAAGSGTAFFLHMKGAAKTIIQDTAKWPYFHPQIGRIVADAAMDHIENSPTPSQVQAQAQGTQLQPGPVGPQQMMRGPSGQQQQAATVDNTCAVVDIATKRAVKDIAQENVRREGQNQVVERIKRARENEWFSNLYTRLPGADALTALAVASNAALEPNADVHSVLYALAQVCGPDAPMVTEEGRQAYMAAEAASRLVDQGSHGAITSTRLILAAIAKVVPKRNLPAEAAILATGHDAETDLQNLMLNNAGVAPPSPTGIQIQVQAPTAQAPGPTPQAALTRINELADMFEMSPRIQTMVNNARALFQPGATPTIAQVQQAVTVTGANIQNGRWTGQFSANGIRDEINTSARASSLGADLGQKIGAINVKPSRAPNHPVDAWKLDQASKKLGELWDGLSDGINKLVLRNISTQPAPTQQPQTPPTDPFAGLTADQKRNEQLKSLQDFYIKTEQERPINEEALLLAEQEKARLRQLNPGHSNWIFPHFTGIGGAEKDERDFTMLIQHISDAIGFDVGVMMERVLVKGKAYGAAGLFGNLLALLPSIIVTQTHGLHAGENLLLKDHPKVAQISALCAQAALAFYAIPKTVSWLQQPMLQYLQIGYSGGVAEREIDLRSTQYVVDTQDGIKREYVDYNTSEIEAAYYEEKRDISTPDKALFKELEKIGREIDQAMSDLALFRNNPAAVQTLPEGPRNLEEAEAQCVKVRERAEQWLEIFQKRLSMCDTNNLGQFMQSFGRCLRNLELSLVPVYNWLHPQENPAFVHIAHMGTLAALVPITMAFGAIDERLKWGEAFNGVSLHTDFRSDEAIRAGYRADHPDPDKRLQANMGHFNLDLVRKSYAGAYQLRYKMLDQMTDHEVRIKQEEIARLLSLGPEARIDQKFGNTVGKWTLADRRKITDVHIRRYEILTAKRIGIVPTGDVAGELGAAQNPARDSIRELRQRDWATVSEPRRTAELQTWLATEKGNHAPLEAAEAAALKDLKSKAGMSVMTPEMWIKYDAYCARPAVVTAGVTANQIRNSLNQITDATERAEALDLHRMAQYSLRPWQFKKLDILQRAAKWTPAAKLERDLSHMSKWQGPQGQTFADYELERYKDLLRKSLITLTRTQCPATAVGLTVAERNELTQFEEKIRAQFNVENATKFQDLASLVATGWTLGETSEFLDLHANIAPAREAWDAHSQRTRNANPLLAVEQDMEALELDKLTRLYDWTALTDQSKKNIETSWGDPGTVRGWWKDVKFALKSGRTRQTQIKFMGPEDAQRHGALNQGPIAIGASMPLLLGRLYGVLDVYKHPLPLDWRIGLNVGFGALSLIGNFNYGNLVNDKQVKFGVLARYDYEDPHKTPRAAYSTARLSLSGMTVQKKTLRDFNFGSKAQAIRVRRLMRDLATRRQIATETEQGRTHNFVMRGAADPQDLDEGRPDKMVDPLLAKDPKARIEQLMTGIGSEADFLDFGADAILSKTLRKELEKLLAEREERDAKVELRMPAQLLSDEDSRARSKRDLQIEELRRDIAYLEKIDPVPMQDPMVLQDQVTNWRGIANEFDEVLADVSERMFFNYRLNQDPLSVTTNEHDGTLEHTLPEEKLHLVREQFKLEHAEGIMRETRRQLYFRDLAHRGWAILSHINPETDKPQAESHWELTDDAVDQKESLDRTFNERYEAAWTAKKAEGFLMSVIAEEKKLNLAEMDYAARKELLSDKEAVDRAFGKLVEMGMKVRDQAAPVAVAEQKKAQAMSIELAKLEAERAQDRAMTELPGAFPTEDLLKKQQAQKDRDARIDELTKALSGIRAESSVEESNDLTKHSAYRDLDSQGDRILVNALIDKMNENQIVAAPEDVQQFVTSCKVEYQHPPGVTWMEMGGTDDLAERAEKFVAQVKTERSVDDINKKAAEIDLTELPRSSEEIISDIFVNTILEPHANEVKTEHSQTAAGKKATTQTAGKTAPMGQPVVTAAGPGASMAQQEQRRLEREHKERITKLTETVQGLAKDYAGKLTKAEYIRANMAWGEKFGRGTDSKDPPFKAANFVQHLEELKANNPHIKLDDATVKAIFQENLERAPQQSRERSASIDSSLSGDTIAVDPREAAQHPKASESDREIAFRLTKQQFPEIKLVTVRPLEEVQKLYKMFAGVLSAAIVGRNNETGELMVMLNPEQLQGKTPKVNRQNVIVTKIPGSEATNNLPVGKKFVDLTVPALKRDHGQQVTTGQEQPSGPRRR